jgi:hypothetical protein
MMMRTLKTLGTAALLLTLVGCDSEPECGEPLYAANATDEAWHGLVDALKKAPDSSRAVTLLSPTEGQVYTGADAAPRWEWSSPLQSSLGRSSPQGMLALQARPRPSRSVLSWVGELLVPTAHAHLPPYTGELYLVEVSIPGRTCPVQVLTSELAWQLDTASWDTLRDAAGNALTVQVTSAYMEQNRVTEGPYRMAAPRTIRMEFAR